LFLLSDFFSSSVVLKAKMSNRFVDDEAGTASGDEGGINLEDEDDGGDGGDGDNIVDSSCSSKPVDSGMDQKSADAAYRELQIYRPAIRVLDVVDSIFHHDISLCDNKLSPSSMSSSLTLKIMQEWTATDIKLQAETSIRHPNIMLLSNSFEDDAKIWNYLSEVNVKNRLVTRRTFFFHMKNLDSVYNSDFDVAMGRAMVEEFFRDSKLQHVEHEYLESGIIFKCQHGG
jgi:hypothetical protein